tara:strand:- start:2095 stop:2295 length:201 start_codon:yes stop_codon:yes gene_type:complete
MPYMRNALVILVSLMLWGCPGEECENKVMQCEDDVEMFCEKNESGCGEDCHYFSYEYCYEVCKDDG